MPQLVRLPSVVPDALAARSAVLIEAEVLINEPRCTGTGVRPAEPERAGSDTPWLLRMQAPVLASRARPGQFAMLTVARPGEAVPVLPRPMALFAWDEGSGSIDIVYRIVGAGTRLLSAWRPGERMTVVGPLGRGFWLRPETRAILAMGRGIGSCSLTALAKAAVERSVRVQAVSSARTAEALVGGDLYRECGVQRVLAVTDADGSSSVDRLRSELTGDLQRAPVDQIFVCGSRRLLRLATELAAACGADVQVSLEAHMACGLGYCHGCASGAPGFSDESPLVCTDGPVFACLPE